MPTCKVQGCMATTEQEYSGLPVCMRGWSGTPELAREVFKECMLARTKAEPAATHVRNHSDQVIIAQLCASLAAANARCERMRKALDIIEAENERAKREFVSVSNSLIANAIRAARDAAGETGEGRG